MLGSRDGTAPVPGQDRRSRRRDRARSDLAELPHDELARLISTLEEEMREAAADLRFEYAARLRDEIQDLKGELKELLLALSGRARRRPRAGAARSRWPDLGDRAGRQGDQARCVAGRGGRAVVEDDSGGPVPGRSSSRPS